MSKRPVFMLLAYDGTDENCRTDSIENGQADEQTETAKDNQREKGWNNVHFYSIRMRQTLP